MPKLYSGKDVRGSHIKLKGLFHNQIHITIVPNHRQIARGTFESILKQVGMTHLEFESYYR